MTKTNFVLKDIISEKNLGLYHIDEEVQQFRYDTMTEFISKLAKYVKSKNKNVKNIVCFLSTMDERAATNWNDITSIDEVDVISTSAYYLLGKRDISYVNTTAKKILTVVNKYNKPVLLWFQLFGVSKEKTEEIRTAINLAKQEGIKNFAVWAYKGSKYMSHFPSEEPEKLWEIIKDEFSKIF